MNNFRDVIIIASLVLIAIVFHLYLIINFMDVIGEEVLTGACLIIMFMQIDKILKNK